MYTIFKRFSVDIVKDKFTTPEGIEIPHTAIVTFVNKLNDEKIVEKFGYYHQHDLFELIDHCKPIVLDHCYIDTLSVTEYRNKIGVSKKDIIELKSLSAYNSFFNPHTSIDLSFVKILEGNINFENSFFSKGIFSLHASILPEGTINFSNSHLNCDEFDFSYINFSKGTKNFKNIVFSKGNINFQDSNFSDGDLLFNNTEFGEGDVSFVNCRFGAGEVAFKVARFGHGKKDFHYAKFLCEALSFERCEFADGKVDFRTVEFNNTKVNFNRSVFGNAEISFEASELLSGKFNFKKVFANNIRIDFSLAEFENVDASFEGSEIGKGSISFYNSKFFKLSLKSCHLDQYVDLRLAQTNILDLSDTIIRDIIDIKPYDFPVNIKTINFEGMRLIGQLYIDWKDNNVLSLIESQNYTTLKSKSEQFNILKQNFNKTGQYDDEDKAYVMFKRFEAKTHLYESTENNRFLNVKKYPVYAFKWLVFDKVGLYATSPARVISSMLIVLFLASMFFTIVPYFTDSKIVSAYTEIGFVEKFFATGYYVGITFFTVGYGEYTPTGILRLAAVVTAFVGVFMMSYFTVAFVRKILR